MPNPWPLSTALLSLLMLAGCGRAPERNRAVVVYASVDQVYAEPVLQEFGRRTGIRVLPVYDVEAAKTTGLVNRLLAEKTRPRADVFWNGEFVQTLLLERRGVLAPYRSPAASGLPAELVDPEGFWTVSGARARVLLANTKLLPQGLANPSLASLGDGKLPAGRMGVALPLFGTSATHAAALAAVRGTEETLAFYRSLKQRGVRVVDGNAAVRDLVVAGELAIGLTDSDDACGAIARGAAVRIEIPDQDAGGTFVVPATVALVAGGPNPDAGRRLLDYLAGPETERRLIEAGFFQLSVRDSAAPAGCLAGRPVRALKVALPRVLAHFESLRPHLEEIFVR